MPDGTSFRNPAASGPGMRDPEAHGELEQGDAGEQAAENPLILADLRLQKKTMDVWTTLPPDKRVSPHFRADFSQLSPVPDKLVAWAGKKIVYPPGMKPASSDRVSIFWPPASRTGARKIVNVDEIVSFLNTLPPEARQKLKGVLRERAQVKAEILNAIDGPNEYMGPQLSAPGRALDVNAVFKETRRLFLDEIAKGRDPSDLSPDETAAYAKVASVRLAKANPKSPFCLTPTPNAYYIPEDHSFSICPNFNGWPKSLLMRTMAHEMAHSIDPCQQTVPLLKLNKANLAKLPRSPSEWPVSLTKNSDMMNVILILRALSEKGATFSNFKQMLFLKDPSLMDEITRSGYADLAAIAIPDGDGISRGAYACLRDQGKFAEITDKNITAIANSVTDSYGDEMGKKFDRQAFHSDLTAKLKKHSQCHQIPGHTSHMCEAMSDAWSAKVMGRHFETNPPKDEIEKLAFVSLDLQSTCSAESRSATGRSSDVTVGASTLLATKASGPHPSDRKRMDRIMLTDARTQKAFGCEPDPKLNCVAKLGMPQTAIPSASKKPSAVKKGGTQNQGVQ
jgi:hypothetical protein